MVREDTRRKCCQTVVVEKNVKGVKKEGMIMEWKGNGKGIEGRETNEDGRGKGGNIVVMKIWRKRGMRESEMEKRK